MLRENNDFFCCPSPTPLLFLAMYPSSNLSILHSKVFRGLWFSSVPSFLQGEWKPSWLLPETTLLLSFESEPFSNMVPWCRNRGTHAIATVYSTHKKFYSINYFHKFHPSSQQKSIFIFSVLWFSRMQCYIRCLFHPLRIKMVGRSWPLFLLFAESQISQNLRSSSNQCPLCSYSF